MTTEHDDPAVSPVPLMQLATGFWAFKTLAAAHELDLFTRLSGTGGTTSAELAETLGIDHRPAEMLLTGCAALGLLEKDGGTYIDSALADDYLVRGKPYYFGGFVQMLDKRLYPGWGRLTEAIRTNRPTTWDPDRQTSLFEGVDPEMLAFFWEAMHSLSTFTARSLGEAVDLSASADCSTSVAVPARTTSSCAGSIPNLPPPSTSSPSSPRSRPERSRTPASRSGSGRSPAISSPTRRFLLIMTSSCSR